MNDQVSPYSGSKDRDVFCACCFSSPEQLPGGLPIQRRGTCPWCGSRNQKLFAMADLSDRFWNLAKMYPIAQSFDDEPNQLLAAQIQEDWGLFSDKLLGTDRVNTFVQLFRWAGRDPRDFIFSSDPYELVKPFDSGYVFRFIDSLASYLNGEASEGYIDYEPPPLEWFLSCVEDAVQELSETQSLYRAQVWDKNTEVSRFSRERMKAPPCDKASPGRANREGQRTLYCSDDIGTCIAEVRPFKGAGIAVSQIALLRPIRVIDFCDSRWISEPLKIENIEWAVQTSRIIRHIDYLFSIPANPTGSALYYEPTQALCDSLRSSGYDGIKYRSSLGSGANFAFFDPDAGLPEEPEYYWIHDISIRYSDAEPFDVEYPEHPYSNIYRRTHS